MAANKLFTGLAIFALISISPKAFAQAPTMSTNVWTPPNLSFNECMQRAQTILRNEGSKDVALTTNFSGMGWVTGSLGDYRITIACATFKGTVFFAVAGTDFATADNYMRDINGKMENPVPKRG